MKRSVLITGLARDVCKDIESQILLLEQAFRNFDEIHFLIIESDSMDDTVLKLKHLQSRQNNFYFISLGNLQTTISNRIERLAFCRDIYMNEIRENATFRNIDYVCVVDFDLVNDELTAAALESTFLRNDWCGVFANQAGAYYDIFALRAKNWSEGNCWESDRILREQGMHPILSQQIAVYSKRRRIMTSESWIPVESAFGGLGIYKRDCIANLKYQINGLPESGVCEHVPFNTSLSNRGHKLFINPALVNFSWNDHNESEAFLNRTKRRIRFLFLIYRNYLARV